MEPEHYRDGVGICIYCDKCADEDCCPNADPCSRSVLIALDASMKDIQARFRAEGRI